MRHLRQTDPFRESARQTLLPGLPLERLEQEAPPHMNPMLAVDWDGERDVDGWMMAEKFDGFRALWDGQRFVSREGMEIPTPAFFRAGLPPFALDGELWAGRGGFEKAQSCIGGGEGWEQMRFMVFDVPCMGLSFRERTAMIPTAVAAARYARTVDYHTCLGVDHVRAELARVVADGGEGLVLRNPKSRYEQKRSYQFLKAKPVADAEARVLAHNDRHSIRVLGNGLEFNIAAGLPRETLPPVGCVVTFSYRGRTANGVPRHAAFMRVRHGSAPIA